MLVELRNIGNEKLLDRLNIEDPPFPGRWFELNGASFLVLKRSHRYALQSGRYQLASVALIVKRQRRPADASKWHHGWVIGDPTCRFNARSPLLRCAVLPEGPCERCHHFCSR